MSRGDGRSCEIPPPMVTMGLKPSSCVVRGDESVEKQAISLLGRRPRTGRKKGRQEVMI